MRNKDLISIAAITKNRGIGKDGDLLVRDKEDLKHFKELTIGKVVVMGFNTFESLGFSPLPNRMNIVLTENRDGLVRSKLIEKYGKLPSNVIITGDASYVEKIPTFPYAQDNLPVCIIGGEKIYELFKNKVSKHILTIFDVEKEADTFYPKIDENIYNKTRTKVFDNFIIKTYEEF